jgi:hypothetical protein
LIEFELVLMVCFGIARSLKEDRFGIGLAGFWNERLVWNWSCWLSGMTYQLQASLSEELEIV